ncbi:MAG: YicC family protein [Gammaproteobacteria bacterium]|nr:YicC family protein [Gammaproteobacteria bacterium]
MISSMTAFSRAVSKSDQGEDKGELVWELRSVNNRYLEVMLRLPDELRVLEPLVRERLTKRLGRGKVDGTLRYSASGEAPVAVRINEQLARGIIDAASKVGRILHDASSPKAMDVLQWPGVVQLERLDLSPVQQRAVGLLDQAIEELISVRQREGSRLEELILQRTAAMRVEVEKAKALMPRVLDAIRERLRARLEEVSEELDPGRLEQEMALLAQKLDVDEEMDRLQAHLDEVDNVITREGPVGRRLDFLMQELNREANTLTSKSNDVEVTRVGVELKVLIEQVREQVQNIE